ncbi:ABC-2 type transporter-domain-containing protein [Haematococcus lacustris]
MVGGQLPGGLQLRGLSGGEKKRLSLAVGIIAAPAILFLDEPTSGLDSHAALSVMSCLSTMAKEGGHIIIASIHQPRSTIWSMFDSVTVLSGGLMMFTGRREDMVPWFTQHLPALVQPALALPLPHLPACCCLHSAGSGASSCSAPDCAASGANSLMTLVLEQAGSGAGGRPEAALLAARSSSLPGPLTPAPSQGMSRGCSLFPLAPAAPACPQDRVKGEGVRQAGAMPDSQPGAGSGCVSSCCSWQFRYRADVDGVASDWVMDLVSVGFTKPQEYLGCSMSSRADLDCAAKAFTEYHLAQTMPACCPGDSWRQGQCQGQSRCADSAAGTQPGSEGGQGASGSSRPATPAALCRQHFFALLGREVQQAGRNPADMAGRLVLCSWTALIVGLAYHHLPTSPDGVRLRVGLHALNTCFFMLIPYVYMGLYTSDRRFFLADMASGLYKPSLYYMAKVLACLPAHLLPAVSYALITYGLAGLRHSVHAVLHVVLLTCLIYLVAAQVLHCAAVLAPNQDLAFVISIAWTAVNILACNYLILYSQMELQWLAHLRWVGAMGFAFSGMAREELLHAHFDCSGGLVPEDVTRLLPQLLPRSPLLTSTFAMQALARPGAGCRLSGDALIEYYGLGRPFPLTCGLLLAYLVVMHGATFGALLLTARKERR